MRKRNLYNKPIALLLAFSMCMGTCGVKAYAEDGTVVVTETTTDGGLTTDSTTSTTTTTDEDGNVTVVVKIEEKTQGTDGDGLSVDGQENYDETKISDEDGKVKSKEWISEGTESKEGTIKDDGNKSDQQKIEVDLKPGETTNGSATSHDVTGDVKSGEDDEEYNYTITDTVEREATVTSSDIKIEMDETDSDLKGPITDREGKSDKKDLYNDDGHFTDPDAVVVEGAPEGYEYKYSGTGDYSHRYVGAVTVIYEKDPVTGETLVDENGNYVIKEIKSKGGKKLTVNGEASTDINATFDQTTGSRAILHFLKSESGEIAYAYCVDLGTGTKTGSWYTVANLEDNDYYATDDAEKHIRAIALNGYWGTSNEPDENGNYQFGSLASIKQKMKDAIKNGEIENTVVKGMTSEDGGPVYLLDIIDELTEGEALDMTQAAIWSFANRSIATQNGEDGAMVAINSNPEYLFDPYNKKEPDPGCSARINALYNWLLGLTMETPISGVINETNYLQDMAITIGDKTADAEENKDEDMDNDIYNVDMKFTLAFVPTDKDDLLVRIMYTDLDGNPVSIVRRLAGSNAEGQTYESILPDENGNYTLTGLTLRENEEFDFDLKLEGTQYLERGVYIYTAHGGIDKSQTLVGVAEGTRDVEVTASMMVSFNVDEDDKVKSESAWREVGAETYVDPEDDPQTPPTTPTRRPVQNIQNRFREELDTEIEIDEDLVPLSDTPDGEAEDDGLVELEDEEVPLADAPETGDMSVVYLLVSGASGMSALGLTVLGKKKEEE